MEKKKKKNDKLACTVQNTTYHAENFSGTCCRPYAIDQRMCCPYSPASFNCASLALSLRNQANIYSKLVISSLLLTHLHNIWNISLGFTSSCPKKLQFQYKQQDRTPKIYSTVRLTDTERALMMQVIKWLIPTRLRESELFFISFHNYTFIIFSNPVKTSRTGSPCVVKIQNS